MNRITDEVWSLIVTVIQALVVTACVAAIMGLPLWLLWAWVGRGVLHGPELGYLEMWGLLASARLAYHCVTKEAEAE